MMYLDDIMDTLNHPYEKAKQAMYSLLRQGLLNGAAIPEVETEAEQAAHHFLGCDNYLALLTVYATAEDARKDESGAADIIVTMADDHLMLLTQAILLARGPVGDHKCDGSRQR